MKSTSRRYGIECGHINLTARELDVIRDRARDYLLDDSGFDTARAWVKATLGYLVQTGALQPPPAAEPTALEEVRDVVNIDTKPRRY